MSNAPPLPNPALVQTPQQFGNNIGRKYADFMRENGLSAAVFIVQTANRPADSMVFGGIVEQLRREGLKLVSHSTTPMGEHPDGAVQLFMSLHVESLDGEPSRLVRV